MLTQKNIFYANNRKLLGNPPTSPDKHTIGDEIIWEMILENIKDDYIEMNIKFYMEALAAKDRKSVV